MKELTSQTSSIHDVRNMSLLGLVCVFDFVMFFPFGGVLL